MRKEQHISHFTLAEAIELGQELEGVRLLYTYLSLIGQARADRGRASLQYGARLRWLIGHHPIMSLNDPFLHSSQSILK